MTDHPDQSIDPPRERTTETTTSGWAAVDHVNLRIPLSHPEVPSEYVWAVPIGEDRYRIANVPFLVHHVGLGDVVVAAHVSPGDLELVEVVERAHVASFTYELHRIVDTAEFIEQARAIGIATEGMAGRLFASSAADHPAADRLETMLTDAAVWFERYTPDGTVLRSHGDVLGG